MNIYSLLSWVFYIVALIALFRSMVVLDITSLAYLAVGFACIILTIECSKRRTNHDIPKQKLKGKTKQKVVNDRN